MATKPHSLMCGGAPHSVGCATTYVNNLGSWCVRIAQHSDWNRAEQTAQGIDRCLDKNGGCSARTKSLWYSFLRHDPPSICKVVPFFPRLIGSCPQHSPSTLGACSECDTLVALAQMPVTELRLRLVHTVAAALPVLLLPLTVCKIKRQTHLLHLQWHRLMSAPEKETQNTKYESRTGVANLWMPCHRL